MNCPTLLQIWYLVAELSRSLFRLLQAAGVAGLGVDGAPVEVVRAARDHLFDVFRVGERDEAEPPRAARLRVLHHDAVDDLAETGEVAKEGLLSRVPTEQKKCTG